MQAILCNEGIMTDIFDLLSMDFNPSMQLRNHYQGVLDIFHACFELLRVRTSCCGSASHFHLIAFSATCASLNSVALLFDASTLLCSSCTPGACQEEPASAGAGLQQACDPHGHPLLRATARSSALRSFCNKQVAQPPVSGIVFAMMSFREYDMTWSRSFCSPG
jgi:hypothetical protein